MNTGECRTDEDRNDQVFRFFIEGGSVTRATVTILAQDLEIALRRVHALFPGSDHREIEARTAGHH